MFSSNFRYYNITYIKLFDENIGTKYKKQF